jgi:taurine dioxygenase
MLKQVGIEVVSNGTPLGHEIRGVDLSQPLTDAAFAPIEKAFDDIGVVLFRNQKLTPEQHIAFSRRFGKLEIYPIANYLLPGHPEIFVVSNIVENGKPIGMGDAGRVWHTDMHFTPNPARCSLLYALEVPHRNGEPLGDTCFASSSAAYDALSPAMKQKIDGRLARNSYNHYVQRRQAKTGGGAQTAQGERSKESSKHPDVWHPLVRVHPKSGRKCLYVSDEVTCGIEGMADDDAQKLLKDLLDHMTQPRFVYRHKWKVGDLVIWDNCSAIHLAIGDFNADERRRMHRTTVEGGPTR